MVLCAVVKAIARALSLPSTETKEETVLMIEGKLTEGGREPQNVQVGIVAREGMPDTLDMELIGEDGPFLSVQPQRAVARDALAGALELDPGDPEGEGSHDRPSSELQQVMEENDSLKQRLSEMQDKLNKVTECMRSLWRTNCSLLRECEGTMSDKDGEIECLKQQLAGLQGDAVSNLDTTDPGVTGVTQSAALLEGQVPTGGRKGRAPPVDPFNGEDETVRLDDWVPALQRVAAWNGWSEADLLLQLAGHRGRALQEWELIAKYQKATFYAAVDALRERLEPGGRMLAVQDFRHAAQKGEESVADFIRRLE